MLDRMFLSAGSAETLYVEDVFSTWLYTGNGSTQTITNGIDLSGKGGMVWIKLRASASSHALFDTARAATNYLQSNSTSGTTTFANSLTSFNSNGFSLGSFSIVNQSTQPLVSWTFRKAPKFFDVVTWTGDGTFKRVLNHSLGVAPGFIVVKRTDTTSNWWTYHRGVAGSINGYLNLTNAFTNTGYVEPGSVLFGENPAAVFDVFNAGSGDDLNVNGGTYVAYLFAHDATADGIIQCGSYTGNGSSNGPTVNLGWEPQWLMIKNTSGTGSWQIIDNMRGMPVGSADATLQANLINAESSVDYVSPAATGFQVTSSSIEVNTNASTYIYIAIRRGPMKTPTVGTSVFAPDAFTGTGTTKPIVTSLSAPDLIWLRNYRPNVYTNTVQNFDRLRGNGVRLRTGSTDAETTQPLWLTFTASMSATITTDGETNANGVSEVAWGFKRAPGFFDEVCYTGTGAAQTLNHNLGVAPELMIIKSRSGTGTIWYVYSSQLGIDKALKLNTVDQAASGFSGILNNTVPSATSFSLATTNSDTNASGTTYVTYLFASCPGVSKVGSYTGNGSSQTINCGFTNGARFFLVKASSASGNWWVWDSARGITAPADPALTLNSTAAEVTSADATDPDNSGIIVNQEATCSINANGVTYIFLAIA